MPGTDIAKLTPKGRATRARIVSATTDLMLQRGVERTTIEDITEAAEISTSQLYHYFTDKSALVAAVIDFATDSVLSVQQMGLDRIESVADLHRWRAIMVDMLSDMGCAGGCPIGSLASELSETDPLARARLAHSFSLWERAIHEGMVNIAHSQNWADHIDIDQVTLGLLAAVEGGLLLAQVRRETLPLEAAIDTMIDYFSLLGAP